MSKVIIVRCVRCLKPYNINFAALEYDCSNGSETPKCPHCRTYGMSFEDIIKLQPEIEEKLKKFHDVSTN
jgi:hypothetical protein